jgi:cytidylate kinase
LSIHQKFQKKIIVAIDGFSSCGKSTLAKSLANRLKYGYIDSGAMYRAVCLFFLQNHIDINNLTQVENNLRNIHIHFESINDENQTFLNGNNVNSEIRSADVTNWVSEVARIASVRKLLVTQQLKMGLNKGIVMDGRDIGTVVFPNAELKIFLTASLEVRAKRRFLECQEKGLDMSLAQIKKNLIHRDHIDSTRKVSPLKKADDAFLLDNSNISKEDQLNLVYDWAQQKINC